MRSNPATIVDSIVNCHICKCQVDKSKEHIETQDIFTVDGADRIISRLYHVRCWKDKGGY